MHAADVNHACGISPMPVPHTAPDDIDCRLAWGKSLEMRVRCRRSAWMVLRGTRTNRVRCAVRVQSRPVGSQGVTLSHRQGLVRFMSLYHVFSGTAREACVLRHNTLSLDNDPIALPERGGRSPAARWRFRLRGRIRSGRARVMDQLRWLRKDTLVRLSRLASTAHKPPSTFVRPPCTGHNPSQMSRT